MFDPKDVEDLNRRFDALVREQQDQRKHREQDWSGQGGFQKWMDDLDNEEWDWPWSA